MPASRVGIPPDMSLVSPCGHDTSDFHCRGVVAAHSVFGRFARVSECDAFEACLFWHDDDLLVVAATATGRVTKMPESFGDIDEFSDSSTTNGQRPTTLSRRFRTQATLKILGCLDWRRLCCKPFGRRPSVFFTSSNPPPPPPPATGANGRLTFPSLSHPGSIRAQSPSWHGL